MSRVVCGELAAVALRAGGGHGVSMTRFVAAVTSVTRSDYSSLSPQRASVRTGEQRVVTIYWDRGSLAKLSTNRPLSLPWLQAAPAHAVRV